MHTTIDTIQVDPSHFFLFKIHLLDSSGKIIVANGKERKMPNEILCKQEANPNSYTETGSVSVLRVKERAEVQSEHTAEFFVIRGVKVHILAPKLSSFYSCNWKN